MANSGSISTSAYDGRYLTFTWWITSQSVEENRTYFSWTLKGAGGATNNWYALHNAVVDFSIGDYVWNAYTQGSGQINLYNGTTVASGSTYWTHGNTGELTLSVSVKGGIYYNAVNCTGSGSMAFNTIPRASKMSSVDGRIIGSSSTINISRASSSFTHTLQYNSTSLSTDGTYVDIGTGIGTSTVWTPPMDLCSLMPNATYGTIFFKLLTYNGSTLIGTQWDYWTYNVPESVVPSVDSISVTESVSGLASKFACFVKGKSKPAVSITASEAYGSEIKSYNSKLGSDSFTGSSFTGNTLTGSTTIVTTVTDSRGRSTSSQENINVVDYYNPTCSITSCSRCDADGTLNNDGECIKVGYAFNIAPVNNKNDHSTVIQYLDGTTWKTVATLSGYSGSSSVVSSGITFSTDKSYQIRLVVKDYFTSVSSSAQIQTSYTLINFNASGKAIAFGKVSEIDNAMEINMPIRSKQIDVITESDGQKTHIEGNWVGFYKADGSRTGWIGANGKPDMYISCENSANLYMNGNIISMSTAKGNMSIDGNGCVSLVGTGVNPAYGCMSSNEFTIKTGYNAIWFNYRTATGGTAPTQYNFGNGSSGYATVTCKSVSQQSDRKAKTEITDIDKAYEFIMGLQPVMYEFRDSEHHRKHMGFIAQDVSELAHDIDIGDMSVYQAAVIDVKNDDKPELYFDEKCSDDKLSWSLNYSEFIAPLVKVVQEQQKTIEELTTRIEALEKGVTE